MEEKRKTNKEIFKIGDKVSALYTISIGKIKKEIVFTGIIKRIKSKGIELYNKEGVIAFFFTDSDLVNIKKVNQIN